MCNCTGVIMKTTNIRVLKTLMDIRLTQGSQLWRSKNLDQVCSIRLPMSTSEYSLNLESISNWVFPTASTPSEKYASPYVVIRNKKRSSLLRQRRATSFSKTSWTSTKKGWISSKESKMCQATCWERKAFTRNASRNLRPWKRIPVTRLSLGDEISKLILVSIKWKLKCWRPPKTLRKRRSNIGGGTQLSRGTKSSCKGRKWQYSTSINKVFWEQSEIMKSNRCLKWRRIIYGCKDGSNL